jgi:AraC-like DNA-binding protein
MRDHPSSPAPALEEILAGSPQNDNGQLRLGGKGPLTELICGGFALEGDASVPILRGLPAMILIRGPDDGPSAWVAATIDLLTAVAASDAPGINVVLSRLADTMLIQGLRVALDKEGARESGSLRATRDPQIARAIGLVHAQPDRSWTVADLAAEVGYSRRAFASRFSHFVGETPIRYVGRIRLTRAAALLEQTDASLAEVARLAGYANEFSFNRAFKRSFGVPPGAYRTRRNPARDEIVVVKRS